MVHRPISPHILAVPISAKTSTHSSTLSQVRSFCWGSDCKTQKEGEEGGQDAGSALLVAQSKKVAHTQPSLGGLPELRKRWPWKSRPQKHEVVPVLQPEATGKPFSLPPSRGRTHHNIQWSCYLRNKENFTAVCQAPTKTA